MPRQASREPEAAQPPAVPAAGPKPAPAVALTAVVHHGAADRQFALAFNGQTLFYRAGQPVSADALLRAALDAAGSPVTWRG